MINLLRKLFIKDYENVNNPKVRQAHGNMAAVVGIISNFCLFLMKLIVGLFTNLVSIIGDSINNLSDMTSSIITLFGFKISQKPADKEHPYGHERYEYISGLIVAVLIIVIGIELIKSSAIKFYDCLFTQEASMNKIQFIVTTIILSVSILIKLWQGIFNKKIGKTINSVSLEATAQDSINDVISTSAVLVASIISYIFPTITIGKYFINLDGLMGVGVAVFIIISGIGMIKETVNPLIGASPESDFVKEIVHEVESYDGVLGIHDVICHMYGPTTCFMSMHVEVDAYQNIMECHDMIDNIEEHIKKNHHVEIVIHMDPVDTKNEELSHFKEIIREKLNELSPKLSAHDFRMVNGPTHTNVIFDVVVPYHFNLTNDEIKDIIQEELRKEKKTVFVVINFDNEYTERG